MTTIVTRAGKGSPLTNVEVDANFTNLNNDKLEKSGGTITANSNDPALKITQTGAGNALVVEDAASDTTPFVISTSGDVSVGGSITQAIGNSTITGGMLTVRSGDGVEGGQVALNNKANTDVVYNFDVDGSDNARIFTTQNNTNLTIGQVIGTGGSVAVYTSGAERMRIGASGNVGIGMSPTSGQALSVSGTAGASNWVISNQATTVAGTFGFLNGNGPYIQAWGAETANPSLILFGSNTGVLQAHAAGLGYGAGAGGTVTQATSKSTAVTLNKPTGQITMHNATLAAGASASFNIHTDKLTAGDGVFVTPVYGPPTWDNYTLRVLHYGIGSFRVVITNISGGSLSDALIFTFQIIKGATA